MKCAFNPYLPSYEGVIYRRGAHCGSSLRAVAGFFRRLHPHRRNTAAVIPLVRRYRL